MNWIWKEMHRNKVSFIERKPLCWRQSIILKTFICQPKVSSYEPTVTFIFLIYYTSWRIFNWYNLSGIQRYYKFTKKSNVTNLQRIFNISWTLCTTWKYFKCTHLFVQNDTVLLFMYSNINLHICSRK